MSFIDSVKLKYITGYFKELPGYPNQEDILYLAYKRAHDKGKNLDSVTFTENNLSKSLGEHDESLLEQRISEMLSRGIIEVSRETKTGNSYRILKNPF